MLHALQFPELHIQHNVQADEQQQQYDHKQRHRLVLHFGNHLRGGRHYRGRWHPRQRRRFRLYDTIYRRIEDLNNGRLQLRRSYSMAKKDPRRIRQEKDKLQSEHADRKSSNRKRDVSRN